MPRFLTEERHFEPIGSKTTNQRCCGNTCRPRLAATVVLGMILTAFLVLEAFIPLRTAVQIGADEGFELAKATLCLTGHHLYTEVWNDQPPLHTFVLTQAFHLSRSVLVARLMTVIFSMALLRAVFLIAFRVSGLLVAGLTTALVIASPGFLELSSSCMLEIPALATALVGIWVASAYRGALSKVLAGVIFGLSLQMKLVPAIYLVIIALVVYFQHQGERAWLKHLANDLAVFGIAMVFVYIASDFWIDRGAYLGNLQQAWASHFGPARSSEYGSPNDHPFRWSVLLKNWDITVLASIGAAVFVRRVRTLPVSVVPLAWLSLTFVVFGIHKPWWPYYYIHTAIPLCWCAGLGAVSLWERFRGRRAILTFLAMVGLGAISWMGARVFLEVSNLRRLPQTYSSPVIGQLKRFKPFTDWLYADQLAYSFYSGIPIVPSVAVLPVKRMWSGEMTNAKLAAELAKYKPGLILLRNDGRGVPFDGLLVSQYQIVYMDPDNRLYALRTIAKKERWQGSSGEVK